MKSFFSKLWANWKELAGYFADFQSRWLLTVFYFTILLPFGFLTRFFADALNIQKPPSVNGWVTRTETVDDIQASKRLF